MRRRTFVGLTGASLAGAILADTASGGWADAIEYFATVLVSRAPAGSASALGDPPDVPSLAAAVARAKRDYQACRYTTVAKSLPALISRSQAACATLDGQARLQAFTLSAEAHHVAASVLLKVGDQGLGWLAADRSMQAARASQDPVTLASSARIITHALMKSKHYKAATHTASTLAAQFDQDMSGPGSGVAVGLRLAPAARCHRGRPARRPPQSRTSCWPRPRTRPHAWAATATCAGRRSARPTPACTGSTSPSLSATRAPRSTWRGR